MVLKPGNHSIHSGIIGMNNKRFEFAAKVSGEIFINKKLDLGEKIYQSALKCFSQLGENYNLGIILLCAPIFEILGWIVKPGTVKIAFVDSTGTKSAVAQYAW